MNTLNKLFIIFATALTLSLSACVSGNFKQKIEQQEAARQAAAASGGPAIKAVIVPVPEEVLRAQKAKEAKERAEREKEEAQIKKEISDEDLEKQKIEAEERRKRPMIKTYTLITHFDTDKYFLTEEFKNQVMEIVEDLKQYEYKMITIEGHTDSTGAKEWNKKLSRQRARSVHDEFIKAGVDRDKLRYAGFASSMPVKTNKTKEGRAANRRTEIFIE